MSQEYLINKNVYIPNRDGMLNGLLTIPGKAKGIIVFVHRNGNKSFNKEGELITNVLNSKGFATLLLDLLVNGEDNSRLQKNNSVLANRLIKATEWLKENQHTNGFDVGFFGASSGASEAITAALKLGSVLKALVSQGQSYPKDGLYTEKLLAPLLEIVSESNHSNNHYWRASYGENQLMESRDCLFEKHNRLTILAKISIGWFNRHLNGVHTIKRKFFNE